ncbi:hypothetical protein RCH09_003380 [Actimicrobium sp. GrIS 1.19]|uniref:FecR family protein n=1 Tax=Actimicrobium sp. GrIS 1.19 TaxID=3071708 RepID=UPI002E096467|nr:hypothetical protein [Actimicrobium sp. GrIS 1.19]
MCSTIAHRLRTGLLAAIAALGLVHAAFAAGEAESIVVMPAGITYTTHAGDTLSSIATSLTSATANWVALGKINDVTKDTSLPIGTPIRIPANLLADDPAQAQVVALFGAVTATGPDGAALALKIGSRVPEGTQLETAGNSFLTVSLWDASRVSIPSNSRIKFARLRVARYTQSPRTEITILRGSVESRVTPLESNMGRFEIRSPLAVAGVRGTHFRVALLANGSTATELLSGAVDVTPIASATPVRLHSGHGNIVGSNVIGAPVALLVAPELVEAAWLQERSSARFVLTPVAGARVWHVQLASDPELQNLLAEARSNDNTVQLDGIPAGTYFARISAIDVLGLEGFPRIVPVNLNVRAPVTATADTPSAPFVESVEGKQFLLKWRSVAAPGFAIELARDPDFKRLQYSANSLKPEAALPRPPLGTYFARVRIRRSDGSLGPFSPAQTLIVTDQWVLNDGNPIMAKNSRTR